MWGGKTANFGDAGSFHPGLRLRQGASIMTADGTLTVMDSVSSTGAGSFQNYLTIADGTGLLAVLGGEVPPGTRISGPAAPNVIGPVCPFQTAYDSRLRLVSFFSDDSAFPSTPEAGLFSIVQLFQTVHLT